MGATKFKVPKPGVLDMLLAFGAGAATGIAQKAQREEQMEFARERDISLQKWLAQYRGQFQRQELNLAAQRLDNELYNINLDYQAQKEGITSREKLAELELAQRKDESSALERYRKATLGLQREEFQFRRGLAWAQLTETQRRNEAMEEISRGTLELNRDKFSWQKIVDQASIDQARDSYELQRSLGQSAADARWMALETDILRANLNMQGQFLLQQLQDAGAGIARGEISEADNKLWRTFDFLMVQSLANPRDEKLGKAVMALFPRIQQIYRESTGSDLGFDVRYKDGWYRPGLGIDEGRIGNEPPPPGAEVPGQVAPPAQRQLPFVIPQIVPKREGRGYELGGIGLPGLPPFEGVKGVEESMVEQAIAFQRQAGRTTVSDALKEQWRREGFSEEQIKRVEDAIKQPTRE